MNVGPLKPGAVPAHPQPRTGAERTNEASPAPPSLADSRRADAGRPLSGDQADLSHAVHDLQPLAADTVAASRLDAGRMRQVLDRVASGWYDRAEVRDVVLGRLSGDLGAAHDA
jgi:hypothetical protein